MSARFITLEGGEGVGKSTQTELLAGSLRALGHTVVATREPGGTPGSEAIRDLLMTGDNDRWSVQAEALLFAAARTDHVERVIRPALKAGHWVICDRYVDSTRAYQGGAGGMADEDIMKLHMIGSDGLLPDRTLVLTLGTKTSSARTAARDRGKADRMGARDATYYASVDLAFLRMAASDPERFAIVDANGSAAAVTGRLVAALDDLP